MDFLLGIRSYGKAVKILFSRKFWWFLLFPILVLAVVYIGGNILVGYVGNILSGLLENRFQDWMEGISWLQWVGSASGILIRIVLKMVYFFLFVAFGGYWILILMSPVYSWLSERTETYLTGVEYPFSWKRLFWEIFRGTGITLRNMLFQFLLSILFFLCSFIPLVGLLAPVALFLTSAYFYGFSFVDYVFERKRLNVQQSVRYVNRNIGLVLGIGIVFAFSLTLPLLDIVACCFVSLLSVIAGAVALHEKGEICLKN